MENPEVPATVDSARYEEATGKTAEQIQVAPVLVCARCGHSPRMIRIVALCFCCARLHLPPPDLGADDDDGPSGGYP